MLPALHLPHLSHRLYHALMTSFVALIAIFGMGNLIEVYWEWWDNPLPYVESEAKIVGTIGPDGVFTLNGIVHAGDLVVVSRSYCTRGYSGVVHQAIVDHFVTLFPDVSIPAESGCVDHRWFQFLVPQFSSAGKYTYKAWYDYRINPIKMVTVQGKDLDFIVIPRTGDTCCRADDPVGTSTTHTTKDNQP